MHFIIAAIFALIHISWGKLETNIDSTNPKSTNKSLSSSLIENCIAGIVKSRPELSSKAAEICSRLAKKNTTKDKTAGRNLADCLAFMRQFSVPSDIHASVCAKILSDLNPKKQQKHAELKEKSTEDSGGGAY